MMKAKIFLCTLLLAIMSSAPSRASVGQDIVLTGQISKLLENDVIVYSDGELFTVPKALAKPKGLKVGDEISIEMTLDQKRALKRQDVPLGSPAPKTK